MLNFFQNIMEVQGHPVSEWTHFETPSAVDMNGVGFTSDLLYFTNHRGEVYISPIESAVPEALKVIVKILNLFIIL